MVVDCFFHVTVWFLIASEYDFNLLGKLFLPAATGKVLASELPKNGNEKCTVLYPASAKASNEIGM